MSQKVKIAWAQRPSLNAFQANVDYYIKECRQLASQGAEIIFLPELCFWDYFCIEEKIENFDLAISLDHPAIDQFRELAKEFQICILKVTCH